jgi:hypothetical protein
MLFREIGMSCLEIKTAKYQTRKSPPFHAKDCKNLTKKGKDGNYVSKKDAKGVYKWVKASAGKHTTRKAPKGTHVYHTHFNGARPFRVEVSGKKVEIYKDATLVKKLTVHKVHCGKMPIGNSILLHLSGKKYMFIGNEIYEFTMEDEFDAYYSIGNYDVPYPVLLGSKYVYFMLEYDHTYIPRDLFKAKMNAAEWADAYAYYYGFKDLETGIRSSCFSCEATKKQKNLIQKSQKKMKGYKQIVKPQV